MKYLIVFLSSLVLCTMSAYGQAEARGRAARLTA